MTLKQLDNSINNVQRILQPKERKAGEAIYQKELWVLLSQSPRSIEYIIPTKDEDDATAADAEQTISDRILCTLRLSGEAELFGEAVFSEKAEISFEKNGESAPWDRFGYAGLLSYKDVLTRLSPKERIEHLQYTREGMIRRVLEERRVKAEKAQYTIKWAKNIYGDHVLTNEKGARYIVFLRDFDREIGYSDSADAAYNKLGTTKHLMFAFKSLKSNKPLYKKLDKTFPFIEIYLDPLNDYKISYYYPHDIPQAEQKLLSKYFKNPRQSFIEDSMVTDFLSFMEEAEDYETIRIRPEVREKVERAYEELSLEQLRKQTQLDFSYLKTELFPYQKEGINFALFRRAAIIADEMGLGKTIQAIACAVFKKQILGFRKILIICPATLKSQWKKEIEKFTSEKALILSGLPENREKQYLLEDHFFFIINYETTLRDSTAINRADFDMLILDEAQKIKNYETKTASAVKRIKAKHTLVITGTPIENRLIDIYSIINTIDPYFLGPLWEFSYKHCCFDPERPARITKYYDLQKLNAHLADILIRREKREVLSQLPAIQERDIFLNLSLLQEEMHAGFMKGISKLIKKKYLTPFDIQKLNLLLASARMVCDSTFLIDDTTNESPKLLELQDILFEKLDIKNNIRKVIIFSEWIKVHHLIADMLREHKVGWAELNGKVPVKARGDLIKNFETNPDCRVFLSTEAGGAGLNLQMADILINFELPWNPAKKNQRIGRIDRLGQQSSNLTIYNLISRRSIEQKIAAGLLVKQNLFDGALSKNGVNVVDFSSKGIGQFIKQLEELINQPEQADDEREVAQEAALTAVSEAGSVVGTTAAAPSQQTEQLEQVLNNGMQFLAGLFKMSTGTDFNFGNQKIEIDQNTGEVVMRFKLR